MSCILEADPISENNLQVKINNIAFNLLYHNNSKDFLDNLFTSDDLNDDSLKQQIIEAFMKSMQENNDSFFYDGCQVIKQQADIARCEQQLISYNCDTESNRKLINDFSEVRKSILEDSNLTSESDFQAKINDVGFKAVYRKAFGFYPSESESQSQSFKTTILNKYLETSHVDGGFIKLVTAKEQMLKAFDEANSEGLETNANLTRLKDVLVTLPITKENLTAFLLHTIRTLFNEENGCKFRGHEGNKLEKGLFRSSLFLDIYLKNELSKKDAVQEGQSQPNIARTPTNLFGSTQNSTRTHSAVFDN